ncbi:MAG: hypothetical protein KIT16_00500 [Rhodospirillaceae bacterium]|nr:hypothetical protein [Rhodospirillaceae bacterium]
MAEKITIGHAGGALLRLPFYVALEKKFFGPSLRQNRRCAVGLGFDQRCWSTARCEFTTGQFIDAVNVQKRGVDAIGVAMLHGA